MKVNEHGIFGVCAVVAMFLVAAAHHWAIAWWYFVIAIVAYSVVIIAISAVNESDLRGDELRFKLGCHTAFLLLVFGLAVWPRNHLNLLLYLIVAVSVGLALPHTVLTFARHELEFDPSGLLGLAGFVVLLAVAAGRGWPALIYLGLVLLTWAVVVLAIRLSNADNDFNTLRVLWGTHLALFFACSGLFLREPGFFAVTGLWIASFAAGIAVPFMVVREAPAPDPRGARNR